MIIDSHRIQDTNIIIDYKLDFHFPILFTFSFFFVLSLGHFRQLSRLSQRRSFLASSAILSLNALDWNILASLKKNMYLM